MPATFQQTTLGIFPDLVNESVQIYMNDFTSYGVSFKEGLENLETVLKRCKHTHVSLSTIKFHMMMEEGTILGQLLLATGIWVDPAKVEVILNFPTPKT